MIDSGKVKMLSVTEHSLCLHSMPIRWSTGVVLIRLSTHPTCGGSRQRALQPRVPLLRSRTRNAVDSFAHSAGDSTPLAGSTMRCSPRCLECCRLPLVLPRLLNDSLPVCCFVRDMSLLSAYFPFWTSLSLINGQPGRHGLQIQRRNGEGLLSISSAAQSRGGSFWSFSAGEPLDLELGPAPLPEPQRPSRRLGFKFRLLLLTDL